MTTTRSSAATTVGELMHADLVTIAVDAPLAEAAAIMDRHHVHGLPVVDPTGRLVGVVSQTDLLRVTASLATWSDLPGLTVRHLMTAPAVTVRVSTALAVAARRMEEQHIHRLVVVADDDERRPIGILSTTDLIHHLVTWDRLLAGEAGDA